MLLLFLIGKIPVELVNKLILDYLEERPAG
jgi:hypothetical protein